MSQRSTIDPAAGALLVLLCAVWGVGQVAIKVGNQGISPLYHAAIRSAGAALLVWGWSAWRGISLIRRDGTAAYGMTIATLFALEFVCIYWGFMFTTAARGVLFIYATPFFVALGAHWLFPAERLSGTKLAGLVAAFAGLALAFADGLRLPTYREVLGDVLELAGAALWAATTLVIKARGQTTSRTARSSTSSRARRSPRRARARERRGGRDAPHRARRGRRPLPDHRGGLC